MSWFCTHDWKVLDTTEKKSLAELLLLTRCDFRGCPSQEGTIVTICSCTKCGKIKKFVTRT